MTSWVAGSSLKGMWVAGGSLILSLMSSGVAPAAELAKPGTVLVIGELHGTAEIPTFTGKLVSSLSKHHQIVVGLEQQEDTENLPCGRTGAFPSSWRDIQDGRSSIAMWQLICELETKRSGKRVKIVFLDRRTESAPKFDPVAAATFIAKFRDRRAIGIVLAGNAHAKNTSDSFAGLLRKNGTKVVTATVSSANVDATAWQCRSDGCGVKTGGSNLCLASSKEAEWIKSPDPRWDYCLLLPKLTASLPAATSEM